MIIKTNGSTRIVILINNYALKIPSFRSWKLFLTGLICNIKETEFSKTQWEELCPIVFSTWGGFLNIMKRTQPLTKKEWEMFDYNKFINKKEYTIPVEMKYCSFGTLKGKIVAVDYG